MGEENNFTKKFRQYSGSFSYLGKSNKVGMGEDLQLLDVYIKEVLYNNPATIVFWSDGTKTVTKCSSEDFYSTETGLAICILKKLIGGAALHAVFEDWLPTQGNRVALKNVRRKYK